MTVTINDDSNVFPLATKSPKLDGTFQGAKGGTEMMAERIATVLSDMGLKDQFNIIHSRVSWTDPKKKNILVCHDTWDDPAIQHLKDPDSRERFAKIVCVSDYQMSTYNMGLGLPYRESIVIKNAIPPIPYYKKTEDRINFIYHTTPHRGLNILVPAFAELAKIHGDRIHLDVYSSFKAYGWDERDKPYEELFEQIRRHPNMTYHGYQPNDVVREALKRAHVFAYPNTWPETSCISVIEAMSAGCEVVCPNHAALPETTGGIVRMYQYSEDVYEHANIFANEVHNLILDINSGHRVFKKNHDWTDTYYNWNTRAGQWRKLFLELS